MKSGIGLRLAAGFALIGIAILCVAAMGLYGLRSLNGGLQHIVENRYPKTEQLHAVIDEIASISIAIRSALIADRQEEIEAQIARVASGRQKVSSLLEQLDTSFLSEEDTGRALQQNLHENNGRYLLEIIKVTRAITGGDKDNARKLLLEGLQPRQEANLASLRKLAQHEADMMKQAQIRAQQIYGNSRNLILLIVGLAAILTAALAWFLTRGITHPLQRAGQLADAIAKGDLTKTVPVSGHDETTVLSMALNTMKDQLVSTVTHIKQVAGSVTTAAAEIAQGNQHLSSRTEQQVTALEETSASIEQLTSAVKHNAENARAASQLSTRASDVAAKSGRVVHDVVQTMNEISASSKKIADIISVIDSIAFQTNILALNAAVEAARAGEQGRGFAVVAAEVRSLAQRSAVAAKEIKTLIGDSVSKVSTGAGLVEQASGMMRELVDAVQHVTQLIGDIATANVEQSAGIAQVNEAIGQMDHVTQQNAALVEQLSAAAESMRNQAHELMDAVGSFNLGHDAVPRADNDEPHDYHPSAAPENHRLPSWQRAIER